MDTVSNGGFLQFSAGGILSPLPGDFSARLRPVRLRHPQQPERAVRVPFAAEGAQPRVGICAERLADFRHGVLAQRNSVLGPEHAVFGEWRRHREWQRPAIRERRSRRAALCARPDSRCHATRHSPMAESECVCFDRGSKHRRMPGRRHPAELSIRKSGTQCLARPDFTWSDFYLTKSFALTEHVKLRFDAQFFNLFNHPNFGLPSMVLAGIPGKPATQTGFGALTYTTSPPTGLLGVGLGGDSTPRMIAFQAHLDF